MAKRDDHVEQLCRLLNLTDDAISIAEGWSILPPRMKKHVQLVINDYIASQVPALARLYSHASVQDQIRFNRIIEAAQAKAREGGDSGGSPA
jgi:hypothetical protein